MATNKTRFRIDRIGEDVSHFSFSGEEAWLEGLSLGGEAKFALPLTFDLEMYRSGDELIVSGFLSGSLTMSCSRCLEPAEKRLEETFRAVYLAAPGSEKGTGRDGRMDVEPGAPYEVAPGAGDLESEDVFYHVDGWVELTPMLREQLVLAIPDRVLCDDACGGICAECGVNLNLTRCDCSERASFSKFGKLKTLRLR